MNSRNEQNAVMTGKPEWPESQNDRKARMTGKPEWPEKLERPEKPEWTGQSEWQEKPEWPEKTEWPKKLEWPEWPMHHYFDGWILLHDAMRSRFRYVIKHMLKIFRIFIPTLRFDYSRSMIRYAIVGVLSETNLFATKTPCQKIKINLDRRGPRLIANDNCFPTFLISHCALPWTVLSWEIGPTWLDWMHFMKQSKPANYLTWAVRELSIVTAVQPSFKILTRLYKHNIRNRSTNDLLCTGSEGATELKKEGNQFHS